MSRKRWWEVYPQGTKEGDEETRFFVSLCRNLEFKYRTVEEVAHESGLTKIRVEELIEKYAKMELVVSSPGDPDMWGYWERVGKKDLEPKSVIQEDHDLRVRKGMKFGNYKKTP